MNTLKCGTIREDGMVYWRARKGIPIWITAEQYKKRIESQKKYVKLCAAEYKRRQLAKPPGERNYIGRYDEAKNLYFITVSSSGKEVWGTKEQLLRYRQKIARNRKRFTDRNFTLPQTNLKFGDPHPTKPGLFVILLSGNKAYFGDKERFKKVRERRLQAGRKRDVKNIRKRREAASRTHSRHKRGFVHPTTHLVFWEYDKCYKEVWLKPDEFKVKWEQSKARRKAYRMKKRINKDLQSL